MDEAAPAVAPLKGLFQMAYVTRDFDRGLEVFAEHYGIPEFGRLGTLQLGDESSGTMTIEVGLAWVGDLQFELIQPLGGHDDLYRAYLSADPARVVFHHVGILVPSHEALEAMRTESIRRGRQIVLSGGLESASDFFYADARPTLGHYLEYLHFTPERLAFHKSMPRY